MLKYTVASITSSVTKLFNQSIVQARICTQWKRSVIAPIPKSSDSSTPNYYQPISLLPLLSKLLELWGNPAPFAVEWGLESDSHTMGILRRKINSNGLDKVHWWLAQKSRRWTWCMCSFFLLPQNVRLCPSPPSGGKIEISRAWWLHNQLDQKLPCQEDPGGCCGWSWIWSFACSFWGSSGLCSWTITLPTSYYWILSKTHCHTWISLLTISYFIELLRVQLILSFFKKWLDALGRHKLSQSAKKLGMYWVCCTGDFMAKLPRILWSSSSSLWYGPIWNMLTKCGILIYRRTRLLWRKSKNLLANLQLQNGTEAMRSC